MSNRAATFKQSDVTRLIKGTEAAGKQVVRVEVTRDKMIVYTFADEVNASDDISKALGMK